MANEFIDREFSPSNLESYASACFDVAADLSEARKKRTNTVLIPSRGAVPIIWGAAYAIDCLKKEHEEYRELYKSLRIPSEMKGYGFPAEVPIRDDPTKDGLNLLLFPFTADINMGKFREGLDNDFYTDATREFFTKVVGALRKDPAKRLQDPFFKFYYHLLTRVEKRNELAKQTLNFPVINCKNMHMIDTAISGRAFTTIYDAFKKIGMEPEMSIIVDEQGGKLRRDLRGKILSGTYPNAKLHKVRRIFTEDRGASLEGVVGVIYPSLMFHALDIKGMPKPIGAGSWYPIPENPPLYRAVFSTFASMLKAAVRKECASYSDKINKGHEEKELGKQTDRLKDFLRLGLLKGEEIGEFPFPLAHNPSKTYETGSHVVHVCFSREDSLKILEDFKKSRPTPNPNI